MSIFRSKDSYLQDGIGFERKRAILYKSLLEKKKIWLTISKETKRKETPKLERAIGIITDIYLGPDGILCFDLNDCNPYEVDGVERQDGLVRIDSIYEIAFSNFDPKKVREDDYNDGQLSGEFDIFIGEEGPDEKYYKTLFGITSKKQGK